MPVPQSTEGLGSSDKDGLLRVVSNRRSSFAERGRCVGHGIGPHGFEQFLGKGFQINLMGVARVGDSMEDSDRTADAEHPVADHDPYGRRPSPHDFVDRHIGVDGFWSLHGRCLQRAPSKRCASAGTLRGRKQREKGRSSCLARQRARLPHRRQGGKNSSQNTTLCDPMISGDSDLARPQAEMPLSHPLVDRGFIGALVRDFYDRVRSDTRLGPVFAAELHGEWEPHLEKMTDFWCSVILKNGAYYGRPVPAHLKLKQVREEDFDVWLDHFRKTAADRCPPEVAEVFVDRAERIARSLKLAMFFRLERPTTGSGA